MRKEDIQTKIDVIFDNLEKLKFFSSKTHEEFISDFRNIDASLHILQTSIQALKDNKLIPEDKSEAYIKMSQFRNRIVHLYNHIDTETLHDILITENNQEYYF